MLIQTLLSSGRLDQHELWLGGLLLVRFLAFAVLAWFDGRFGGEQTELVGLDRSRLDVACMDEY